MYQDNSLETIINNLSHPITRANDSSSARLGLKPLGKPVLRGSTLALRDLRDGGGRLAEDQPTCSTQNKVGQRTQKQDGTQRAFS